MEGMKGGRDVKVTLSAASDGEVCEQQERRKPDRPHAYESAYAFCFLTI